MRKGSIAVAGLFAATATTGVCVDAARSEGAAPAGVPGSRTGDVHYVPPKYHTTLSHWTVRGIEQL